MRKFKIMALLISVFLLAVFLFHRRSQPEPLASVNEELGEQAEGSDPGASLSEATKGNARSPHKKQVRIDARSLARIEKRLGHDQVGELTLQILKAKVGLEPKGQGVCLEAEDCPLPLRNFYVESFKRLPPGPESLYANFLLQSQMMNSNLDQLTKQSLLISQFNSQELEKLSPTDRNFYLLRTQSHLLSLHPPLRVAVEASQKIQDPKARSVANAMTLASHLSSAPRDPASKR